MVVHVLSNNKGQEEVDLLLSLIISLRCDWLAIALHPDARDLLIGYDWYTNQRDRLMSFGQKWK